MAKTHDIESEFAGEHVRPVEEILGEQSLHVVRSLDTATAAILRRPTRPAPRRLLDFERPTSWRKLTKSQVFELCETLNDPRSYWTGRPRYRRLPPCPGFAFKLSSPDGAELLVDLHNPGWELFCGEEEYWGFNFAGPRLAALAKSIFPEYASNHSQSVWKKGAIKAVER